MSEVRGDVTRFAEMYRANYEPVLRYAQRRSRDSDAQDAAAEVFLIAWRRLGEVPDHPLPWLLATARRVLSNHYRGERRRDALSLRLRAERSEDAGLMSDQVEIDERWTAALRSLSFADQEVLALTAWDGLNAKDAAAALECSRSAFATRLSRARRRLSAALTEQGTGTVGPPGGRADGASHERTR